ncbi:MAG: hypothetical protein DCC71_03755 [Proteobacteria bacterium]|nr:MAG: hypothetical protein DCC71_03755 [Pseudomonadota bacterium]
MLLFVLLGPASSRMAAAQEVRSEMQQEQEQKAFWQDRYRRLVGQIREARERLEASGAQLSRARHHRTLRGGGQRLPVLRDRARAEADLA